MKDSKRLIAMSEDFSSLSTEVKKMEVDKRNSQLGSIVYIPTDKAHNYVDYKP